MCFGGGQSHGVGRATLGLDCIEEHPLRGRLDIEHLGPASSRASADDARQTGTTFPADVSFGVNAEFEFIEPGELTDAVIQLELLEKRPAVTATGQPPCYSFSICDAHTGTVVGDIRLRVGDDEDLRLYAGNIGYGVRAEYRGQRFAARAVRLVMALAARHGMSELWITCDPENAASRRTCELAGAEFVEIVNLPPDSDMYQDGERQKCRYKLLNKASVPQ